MVRKITNQMLSETRKIDYKTMFSSSNKADAAWSHAGKQYKQGAKNIVRAVKKKIVNSKPVKWVKGKLAKRAAKKEGTANAKRFAGLNRPNKDKMYGGEDIHNKKAVGHAMYSTNVKKGRRGDSFGVGSETYTGAHDEVSARNKKAQQYIDDNPRPKK